MIYVLLNNGVKCCLLLSSSKSTKLKKEKGVNVGWKIGSEADDQKSSLMAGAVNPKIYYCSVHHTLHNKNIKKKL